MVRPRFNRRNTAALFLCIFTAIPIVRLYGQDKPLVAPPNKSDSFSTAENGKKFRVQHREVARTNFQIAGVDLAAKGDFFQQVFRWIGKVTTAESGDAGTSLSEACYRSADANDSTHLIFIEGEVAQSFTLSSDGSVWKWKTPCKRSPKITCSLATASGLHLGQTQEQVITILGLPTTHSRNIKNGRDNLEYVLKARKKLDPQERAQHMKEFYESVDFYDLSVWIRAKFINNALIKLEVTWIATT